MNAANATQPASGLIPYAPNAPFWSDGAAKERWIGIAERTEHHRRRRRRLGFPERLGAGEELPSRQSPDRDAPLHAPSRRRLGRLHLRVERAADRCDAGARAASESRHRQRPARGSSRAKRSVWSVTRGRGPLARPRDGAARIAISPIRRPAALRTSCDAQSHRHADSRRSPIRRRSPVCPTRPERAGTLAERARAYLHTNCSQCHRPGGSTAAMDLRYTTALVATNACDAPPQSGDLGLAPTRG